MGVRERVRRLASVNALETVVSSTWMYAGRAIGLFWAVLLTTELGINAYGLYAVAIAGSVLIAVPFDHYFIVRVPRVTDASFFGERSTRLIIGSVFIGLGSALMLVNALLGFAVAKAGAEVGFNAQKSRAIREGHPIRAFRLDTFRQLLSTVLGTAYIAWSDDPSLGVVVLLVLVGFAPFLTWAVVEAWRFRPTRPELTRRTRAIVGEAIGGAAYGQLDIVLVGVLASHAAAGYYAYGSLVVWALAAMGQNYSYTFHTALRESDGHHSAGPALRHSVLLSVAAAVVPLGVGVVVLLADGPLELALTFLILAPVTALRTLSTIFTTVLALQHRDSYRTGVTWVCLGVKTGLILALLGLGAPGAALAFLVADVLMTLAYHRGVYRPEPSEAPDPGETR